MFDFLYLRFGRLRSSLSLRVLLIHQNGFLFWMNPFLIFFSAFLINCICEHTNFPVSICIYHCCFRGSAWRCLITYIIEASFPFSSKRVPYTIFIFLVISMELDCVAFYEFTLIIFIFLIIFILLILILCRHNFFTCFSINFCI